ncbi:MAG: hypothetical protein NWS46_06840 [Cyclobacteriaceae bacterium]|nr:hypothetical protein [Cyclobacteriaceae bacterium]
MKVLKIIGITLLVIVGLVLIFTTMKKITPLSWSSKKVNQPLFSNQAINGYDAVAYFSENKAIEGDKMYTFDWENTKWYFLSEGNKKSFIVNPEKYTSEYGGYCVFAVSKGFTADTYPNSFEMVISYTYLLMMI